LAARVAYCVAYAGVYAPLYMMGGAMILNSHQKNPRSHSIEWDKIGKDALNAGASGAVSTPLFYLVRRLGDCQIKQSSSVSASVSAASILNPTGFRYQLILARQNGTLFQGLGITALDVLLCRGTEKFVSGVVAQRYGELNPVGQSFITLPFVLAIRGILTPFEVIKTRVATSQVPTTVKAELRALFKLGPSAFFRGAGWHMAAGVGFFPWYGAYLGLSNLAGGKDKQTPMTSFLVGAGAGFASDVVMSPLRVLRVYSMGSESPLGVREVLRKEGLSFLYRGFCARGLPGVIQSGIFVMLQSWVSTASCPSLLEASTHERFLRHFSSEILGSSNC